MRTTVRRLCGQHPGGPNGVADQLCARMSAPISPPSRRNSGARPPPPLPHMRFTRSASIEKQYQCDRNNPPAGRQEMSPKPDTPIPAINWLVRLGFHAPRRFAPTLSKPDIFRIPDLAETMPGMDGCDLAEADIICRRPFRPALRRRRPQPL